MISVFVPNEQFISTNCYHIGEMLVTFKEVMQMYPNIVLYLDSDGWEILDTRCAKPLFRHSFKHIKALKEDLLAFRRNYINLVYLSHRIPEKRVNGKRSLNYFRNLYTEEELKYFFKNR